MAVENLQEIGDKIRAHLESKYTAREQALRLAREVIQSSATAIRSIHRQEFEEAGDRIANAARALMQAKEGLAGHNDILFAGFIHDAAKEYVEASITLALVRGEKLPTPESLNVEYGASYLNGLGEAVGELRRHLLDYLRRGRLDDCESLLSSMDDIYSFLVTLDYPDAMTGGLRRTTDVVRGILEKTRGDFTAASRQRDLELTLGRVEESLRGRLGE